MTRYQKILTASVIVLVMLNIMLIAFIWTNRPQTRDFRNQPGGMPEIRGRMLQEKLNLNGEQRNAFRRALRVHHQEMQSRKTKLLDLKSRINLAIIHADSTTLRETNKRLFETQREMELASQEFTAFLSKLCNEQQRKELLDVFEEALDRRHPERRED